MKFNLKEIFEAELSTNFNTHSKYLNHQFVKVLKTLGFNKRYIRGEGSYLFDEQGKRYIDMLSGYGVFNIGRSHPLVKQALKDCIDADLANIVQFDSPVLTGVLAREILKTLPHLEKMFFCNSGAEAVEGAIKFARIATKRDRILSCQRAFHGLTLGALSLNGNQVFKQGFGPLLKDAFQIPFNNIEALEKELKTKKYSCFIAEPVQGKGVYLPQDDYFQTAQSLCRKYGTLFIMDEIQTGFGRTGQFWSHQHWDLQPDIVTMAKALSGGYIPAGAIATRKWIFDKVYPSMDRAVVHSSTFAKNNMAAAAGLASLHVIQQENLVERARTNGALLLSELKKLERKHQFLKDVRGLGHMIGVEFGPPQKFSLKAAWNLLEKADKGLFCQMVTIPLLEKHGILTQVAGNQSYVIKLIPSLTLSEEDIHYVVAAFDQVIGEAHKVPGSLWKLGSKLAGQAMSA